MPLWTEVASKVNSETYGVVAIRQVFLGSGPAGAGPGVTVFGDAMGFIEEVAIVAVLGIVLQAGAIWAIGRQE